MPEQSDLPGGQRRPFFAAASLALGLLVLAGLEVSLRALGFSGRPPLFIEVPDRAGFLQANPAVIQRYAPARVDLGTAIEPIPFATEKTPGTYRIVVQGGSTAAGFPYGRWGGLAGMLGDRLEADFPEREIEVITTAMAAVNSNTLVDLVDEILAIEPDAVLLYAGHNEYVGILGIASALTAAPEELELSLALRQLALYRVVELAITRFVPGSAGAEAMPLFERAAGASQVPFGSASYERGIAQFDRNLGEMLRRYREAEVPVYVGTLVSNLRGLPPFIPGPRPETDSARWEEARRQAVEVFYEDPRDLRRALDEWVAVDPRAPGPWFALAKHLETTRDREGARAAYARARDLDPLRFRAPAAFNARIEALASQHGARLVDVEARFRDASTTGIPGNDLLLEHVHPNANGYFLIADAYRDALADDERIGRWPHDDEERARLDMPITAIDRALARWDVSSMLAGFPFRDPLVHFELPPPQDAIERLARQLRENEISWLEAMEGLLQIHLQAGRGQQAAVVARIVAQTYPTEAAPNLAAGLLLLQQEQPARARRYLERSLEAAPGDPRARTALKRARQGLAGHTTSGP